MAYARHPRVTPPTLAHALAKSNHMLATILPTASVGEAARQLAALDVGVLAVVESGALCGTLSHRDIVSYLARGGSLDHPVANAMFACTDGAAASDALESWLQKSGTEARALAVFDQGRLIGLLEFSDLLAESEAHHRRVFNEMVMDERVMFRRGTYSC